MLTAARTVGVGLWMLTALGGVAWGGCSSCNGGKPSRPDCGDGQQWYADAEACLSHNVVAFLACSKGRGIDTKAVDTASVDLKNSPKVKVPEADVEYAASVLAFRVAQKETSETPTSCTILLTCAKLAGVENVPCVVIRDGVAITIGVGLPAPSASSSSSAPTPSTSTTSTDASPPTDASVPVVKPPVLRDGGPKPLARVDGGGADGGRSSPTADVSCPGCSFRNKDGNCMDLPKCEGTCWARSGPPECKCVAPGGCGGGQKLDDATCSCVEFCRGHMRNCNEFHGCMRATSNNGPSCEGAKNFSQKVGCWQGGPDC